MMFSTLYEKNVCLQQKTKKSSKYYMENFKKWMKRREAFSEEVLKEFGNLGMGPAAPTMPQQGNPVSTQMYQMPAGSNQNQQIQQQTQSQQQQMQNDRKLMYDMMGKVSNPVLKASLDKWLKSIFPKQNTTNVPNMNNMGNVPNQY